MVNSETRFTTFKVKFKRPFLTRARVDDVQLSIGQEVKIEYSYTQPGPKPEVTEDPPAEETEDPVDTSISDSADLNQPVTIVLQGNIE